MSAVVVFGAAGRTGVHVVQAALARGYHVTAAARHPERLAALVEPCEHPDRLVTAAVDVRDVEAVDAVLVGADAAISAVASSGRHPHRVFSEGTGVLVKSLQRQHVRRFVCISSRGVNYHDPGLPFLYRKVIRPLLLREVYTDMQKMEQIVHASTLDWTLIRAPRLRDAPARGHYRIEDGKNPTRGWGLARTDLAAFTADQIDSTQWSHRTPTLAY